MFRIHSSDETGTYKLADASLPVPDHDLVVDPVRAQHIDAEIVARHHDVVGHLDALRLDCEYGGGGRSRVRATGVHVAQVHMEYAGRAGGR